MERIPSEDIKRQIENVLKFANNSLPIEIRSNPLKLINELVYDERKAKIFFDKIKKENEELVRRPIILEDIKFLSNLGKSLIELIGYELLKLCPFTNIEIKSKKGTVKLLPENYNKKIIEIIDTNQEDEIVKKYLNMKLIDLLRVSNGEIIISEKEKNILDLKGMQFNETIENDLCEKKLEYLRNSPNIYLEL